MPLGAFLLATVLFGADLSPVAMSRPCEGDRIALVSEGRAQVPIVTADGVRERWAAHYLATSIRNITGVLPEVLTDTPEKPVNRTPALRIAPAADTDAFRVMSKNGSVYFTGRSDFAVFDWCERVLGVRYYFKDAKTFPCSHDLFVAPLDYADWPVFSHRHVSSRRPELRTAKLGGIHRGGVAVHQPHHWFEDPDVRTNHPNIFARQPDGSRGEMPLLCYGNPETLAYYKQRIDEHIAGVRDSDGIVDTNRHVITVSHWDVRLECTCEHCRRLFDPAAGVTGSGSPVIWGFFLKRLAAWAKSAHPEYTISFLPYLNVCDVPPGLDLTVEGNCEAMVCSMPGLAMFKESSVCRHEEALIYDWARVTGRKVLNWHYGCWPREFTSAPYLYGKTIAAHYRRMAPFQVGTFICGGRGAAERLSTYVWHKCLWNPDIDVEALYDVFAERMFGPAAKPMRRLMTLQEEGWSRPWNAPHCRFESVFGESYPAETVEEMKRLLCEAAECARSDARALKWVRWYAADFGPFFADAERYLTGDVPEPLWIAQAKAAPIVDGDFDEACWRGASERQFVPAFGASRKLRRETTLRAVWTEAGVFMAFQCREPEMDRLNLSAAYGELKGQDTLEIFLSPGEADTCYRLMFDVRNRRVATASDREWTAEGVLSAVKRDRDEWRLEVFVPLESMAPGAFWRGNCTRWHPGSPEERERSRLATHGSEWNQDRDAFSSFWYTTNHE